MPEAVEIPFDEMLLPYRQAEGTADSGPSDRRAYVATMMVDDPDLRKVVVAWTSCGSTWKRPRCRLPSANTLAAFEKRWRWLWRGTRYDLVRLSEISGVQLGLVASKVQQASALRLIYPDGSIGTWAAGVIEQRIVGGRRSRGQRQRQQE